jgi:hypothetical protein
MLLLLLLLLSARERERVERYFCDAGARSLGLFGKNKTLCVFLWSSSVTKWDPQTNSQFPVWLFFPFFFGWARIKFKGVCTPEKKKETMSWFPLLPFCSRRPWVGGHRSHLFFYPKVWHTIFEICFYSRVFLLLERNETKLFKKSKHAMLSKKDLDKMAKI